MTVTAAPRVDELHFPASRFGVAGRTVRVWLPDGYDAEPQRRYPVLYLMDGQNLFDARTAFLGVAWDVGTTAQRAIDKRRIEPVILVGVDNSGAGRTFDYTPVPWQGRGGGADRFAHMLIDEIKPVVDRRYRTRREREATALGGASLGGLFALHTALVRADVFGAVAALSPTVWWGHGALLRLVAALRARPDVRIWLDVGKREAAPLRQHVRSARELLLAKGWVAHRTVRKATLRHAEVARGRHDEASWGKRFERVLKFLFPPEKQVRRRSVRARTAS